MIKQTILMLYFVLIINNISKRYTDKNMAYAFNFKVSVPAVSEGYVVTSHRLL